MKSAVALGSNLGDRKENIEEGFCFLSSLSLDGEIKRSEVIESKPENCTEGAPDFLNAVAEINFIQGDAWALLKELQAFERKMGRCEDRETNSPRTLDLDILYFGEAVIREKNIEVPHPRLAQREFVLKPLSQICPNLVLPGYEDNVLNLLNAIHQKK